MAPEKRKFRRTRKHEYKDYLIKADEFCRTMRAAIANDDWNAAGLTAVHCAISASDAIVTYYGGIRSASKDHADAIKQLTDVVRIESTKTNATHLALVIAKKNTIEYESRLFSESEAMAVANHTEKFLKWAKSVLPAS